MEEEEKLKIWKDGYNRGTENTLEKNKVAIELGNAILNALDERYQKHEEYY